MKAFSGKFLLRIPQDLHQKLALKASEQRLSLNEVCLQTLVKGLSPNQALQERLQLLFPKILFHFHQKIVGLVLFGSVARGTTSDSSDIDLLIVLDSTQPIHRRLYTIWDETIDDGKRPLINPHFCHIPQHAEQAGSLWLETSLDGKILFDPKNQVANFLKQLQNCQKQNLVTRHSGHGQPYWIWNPQTRNRYAQ